MLAQEIFKNLRLLFVPKTNIDKNRFLLLLINFSRVRQNERSSQSCLTQTNIIVHFLPT